MVELHVFEDRRALERAMAAAVVDAAAAACSARGRFVWCVSGGQTPRGMYTTLASAEYAQRIDWARTHIVFGDERCVPPHDPSSNYGMLSHALLRHVPIPAAQVHRIQGELPPPLAADVYERELRSLLGETPNATPLHPFDLTLLGLGNDGHTASLFPHSVDEPKRWVSARRAEPLWRVTLTPLALNASLATWFLVAGSDKAERVADVVQGPARPELLPAQRIAPASPVHWWLDREAAARLDRG